MFRTIPRKIIKNNNRLPNGNDFSMRAIGRVKNNNTFKNENLQNNKYPKGIAAFRGNV